MLLIKVENNRGELVGAFTAAEGDFKSGSKGYKATSKIKIGEKRYQVGLNVVEIGSKPEDVGEGETAEDAAGE